MSTDRQTMPFEPIPHPRAVLPPRFMAQGDDAAASDAQAPGGPSAMRIPDRVRGFLHRRRDAAALPPTADADGRYDLEPHAKVVALPRMSGQADDVTYLLVAQGLPLPAGACAYLVSTAEGGHVLDGARPVRGMPGMVRTARRFKAAPVALIDEFGRAFETSELVPMPPARLPEVQFKRYADSSAKGCVDVAAGHGKVVRAAEYVETSDGVALVNARAEFGCDTKSLSLAAACALSFLAFWAFPHRDGYSVATVGVKDALAKLRSNDLFEAVGAIMGSVDEARRRPLVVVPGILSYMAQTLREAGFGEVCAADLAAETPAAELAQMSPDGVPLVDGLSLIAGAPATQGQVIQDIAQLIGSALAASGIPGLTIIGPGGKLPGAGASHEPTIRLIRTTKYANAFYIAFDRDEVSVEGARMLLEAEGLLNRLNLAAETDATGMLQGVGEQDAAALDRWIVDQSGKFAWDYLDGKAKKALPASAPFHDLDVRCAFARGCESLRLPYRLEYSFRFDAESGTLGVEFECPSSAIMPRIDFDPEQGGWFDLGYAAREGLSTRYAAFCAVTVAAVAFWAGETVKTVGVNAWRGLGAAAGVDELVAGEAGRRGSLGPGEPACVLTVEFVRDSFMGALSTPDGRQACEADPLDLIASFRHAFGIDRNGHLTPVGPLFTLEDPVYHRGGPSPAPELDQRALTVEGAELLHARTVDELGIYEGASRKEQARLIMEAFGGQDHLAALAAARDACERTENPLVKDALNRVCEGIATDALTADSADEVARALDDIYGMQAQMGLAAAAVQRDPGEARRILEDLLTAADGNCWFADSKTRLYRYFDSYAARALYALRCPDDAAGRELRLCTDEYFMAHYRMSALISDDLDGGEEAIQHARRCVELGPSVAEAHLRLARCYFAVFDYASEIEAIQGAIRVIWNPKDMGVALYWLGYAFCMTDRLDAGMACYQRCVTYDRSLAKVSASEMAETMRKRGCEPKSFTEREARLAIEAAGVDLSPYDENVEFLMKAAAAVADAGNGGLAANLMGAAGMSLHDDTFAPVLESLED